LDENFGQEVITDLDTFRQKLVEWGIVTQEEVNTISDDTCNLLMAMNNQISETGCSLSTIDWGTLASTVGVDLSNLSNILLEVVSLLQQATGTEFFDFGNLIAYLQNIATQA